MTARGLDYPELIDCLGKRVGIPDQLAFYLRLQKGWVEERKASLMAFGLLRLQLLPPQTLKTDSAKVEKFSKPEGIFLQELNYCWKWGDKTFLNGGIFITHYFESIRGIKKSILRFSKNSHKQSLNMFLVHDREDFFLKVNLCDF